MLENYSRRSVYFKIAPFKCFLSSILFPKFAVWVSFAAAAAATVFSDFKKIEEKPIVLGR